MSASDGARERAQGCLLGQLAGDSLGALVEFRSPTTIRTMYPDGCRDLKAGGSWDLLAGQPTDDSELALTLARCLVKEGKYDPGAVLDAYCRYWPNAWDRGGTLNRALSPACRGRTTEERLRLAAENANHDSQSNGSLMRISPLGIFGAGRPAQAAEWARTDSQLTHPHPVCRDSCGVYVAALAVAIQDGGSPRDCYQAALTEADRSDVHASVRAALETARLAPPTDYVVNMGWALVALQNAFYQLLHAPNLEEGVVDTVMRGGDTDTTAAIAGALLGAVHGRSSLPIRWIDVLLRCRATSGSGTAHPTPPELWPVDALELAEALLSTGRVRELETPRPSGEVR